MGFYVGVEVSDHLSPLVARKQAPKDWAKKQKAARKRAKQSRRRNR